MQSGLHVQKNIGSQGDACSREEIKTNFESSDAQNDQYLTILSQDASNVSQRDLCENEFLNIEITDYDNSHCIPDMTIIL